MEPFEDIVVVVVVMFRCGIVKSGSEDRSYLHDTQSNAWCITLSCSVADRIDRPTGHPTVSQG